MKTPALICIIDDAADYRVLYHFVFTRFLPAYEVIFFADGKEFLEALAQLSHLPNLILLDRHMPNLDGHQTLLRLKEQPMYRKIPVVMVSNSASSKEVNGCYEAGANSFLQKPLSFDTLKQQLELVCHYWLETNLKPVEGV